jgi:hypothetical protein
MVQRNTRPVERDKPRHKHGPFLSYTILAEGMFRRHILQTLSDIKFRDKPGSNVNCERGFYKMKDTGNIARIKRSYVSTLVTVYYLCPETQGIVRLEHVPKSAYEQFWVWTKEDIELVEWIANAHQELKIETMAAFLYNWGVSFLNPNDAPLLQFPSLE